MEKLSFPKKLSKYALRSTLAIATMISLAACPGNKGGGGDAPPVNPLCATTCAGISGPTLLLNQASSRGSDLQIAWQLVGDAAAMATAPVASTPYGNYFGPVLARGGLTVINPLIAGVCSIPVGPYTFETVTIGSMQQGAFSIPVMQAVGPIPFTFSLLNGVIYKPGGYGPEAIYGIINIVSVNGVACGNFGTLVN